MSYKMFCLESSSETTSKYSEKQKKRLTSYLVNGTDLLICDEGHVLKNSKSQVHKMVDQMQTKRRIVLTGTPMQNRLEEYYYIVNLVKPNMLGTLKEFKKLFVEPIKSGEHTDCFKSATIVMKERSYVLSRMMEGFINRHDLIVNQNLIPARHEYAIFVQMSKTQIDLYQVIFRRVLKTVLCMGQNLSTSIFLFEELH